MMEDSFTVSLTTKFTLGKEKISDWPKSGPVSTGPIGPVAMSLFLTERFRNFPVGLILQSADTSNRNCNTDHKRGKELLQLDAFCEHTMQQNATAAGAPSRTPLGELTAHSPRSRSPSWFYGGRFGAGKGRGREGRGMEGRRREREERGRKVDSDAQLEQGRRLAKAGPATCFCE